MGVYIVSWSLCRQAPEPEGEHQVWEFKTLLKSVMNADSRQEAAQAIYDAFPESLQASEGWELVGSPCVLAVTGDMIENWTAYLDPVPANETKRPTYLQPVDD